MINKFINKKQILKVIYLTFALFMLSLSINIFFLPVKISTGGATQIATIVYYFFNIPIWISIFFINLPLYIIAFRVLGKKFVIRAGYSTLMYVIFTNITSELIDLSYKYINNDYLICTIFGALLSGFSNAIILRYESSTGGTDLVAQIINKINHNFKNSTLIFYIDLFLIMLAMFLFRSITIGLYSFIAIYISKKIIEMLFEGVNINRKVNIITKEYVSISKQIREKMNRGVTIIECEPSYNNDVKYHIICLVSIREISKIKSIIKHEDNKAFVYIETAREVLGNGFKDI